jgi:hypothetical protein
MNFESARPVKVEGAFAFVARNKNPINLVEMMTGRDIIHAGFHL